MPWLINFIFYASNIDIAIPPACPSVTLVDIVVAILKLHISRSHSSFNVMHLRSRSQQQKAAVHRFVLPQVRHSFSVYCCVPRQIRKIDFILLAMALMRGSLCAYIICMFSVRCMSVRSLVYCLLTSCSWFSLECRSTSQRLRLPLH